MITQTELSVGFYCRTDLTLYFVVSFKSTFPAKLGSKRDKNNLTEKFLTEYYCSKHIIWKPSECKNAIKKPRMTLKISSPKSTNPHLQNLSNFRSTRHHLKYVIAISWILSNLQEIDAFFTLRNTFNWEITIYKPNLFRGTSLRLAAIYIMDNPVHAANLSKHYDVVEGWFRLKTGS